ncbi:MAG TPA: hypothetical protein VNJ03_05540 [Vicinamibacterales bacterium]|nr:hypothetical protein [Vicinamibacterales bacterium]
MRRPFVKMTALALALVPVAAFAQTPPAQPPPVKPAVQQPVTPAQPAAPAQPMAPGQAAAPATPAAAKLTFKTNAGMLLVQVKPDQTAAFEEMIAKLRTSVATSADETVKQQGNLKVYKSSEAGAGGNALYVVLYDPATPGAEHYWLDVVNKTLTPDQQRDPATREMYTKWAGSIATMNQLNLTKVGGM